MSPHNRWSWRVCGGYDLSAWCRCEKSVSLSRLWGKDIGLRVEENVINRASTINVNHIAATI